MRLNKFLIESLDSDIKIKNKGIINKYADRKLYVKRWQSSFIINGNHYEVTAGKRSPGWHVGFVYLPKGETWDKNERITGTTNMGDSFKVFSGVDKSIKQFVKEIRPEIFYFGKGDKKSSRVKLYRRLAKKWENDLKNYKMSEEIYAEKECFVFRKKK